MARTFKPIIDHSEWATLSIVDTKSGEPTLTLADAKITETWRMNDLGFWVEYEKKDGKNPGCIFIKKTERLEVSI